MNLVRVEAPSVLFTIASLKPCTVSEAWYICDTYLSNEILKIIFNYLLFKWYCDRCWGLKISYNIILIFMIFPSKQLSPVREFQAIWQNKRRIIWVGPQSTQYRQIFTAFEHVVNIFSKIYSCNMLEVTTRWLRYRTFNGFHSCSSSGVPNTLPHFWVWSVAPSF